MKKLFLSIIMGVFTIVTNAQTIHWLTFIDTEDANVGKLDVTGRNVLYSRFVNVINAALHDAGYKSDIHDIYDSALSPEKCKSEVQNLRCDENDIIMFYYIGHGTHAASESNSYPQMLLGCDFSEEHKFIPLKWVHDELKTKGARLTATIGMCCNVVQTASAKRAPTFSVNYGNVELTETERTSIQKMFLGYRGDFLLSSASVGQSSLGGETPLGAMDLFTAVLVTLFEDMSYEGNLDWNGLFTEVKNAVHECTNGKQTPFWDNNLQSATTPKPAAIQKPVAKTPTGNNSNPSPNSNTQLNLNDEIAVKNYLTSYFDCIIDKRNSVSKRESAAGELRRIFTADAVVKFLPQDGNTVIDKENIDDFLERISGSRLLEKVAPVSYRVNGNKISQISIRECYNK